MESEISISDVGEAVRVTRFGPAPSVIVVCEHAANQIPDTLDNLGLDAAARRSHIAWDPGALGVATQLARDTGAILVEGTVSRLVYDCNRPPDAPSAIPARSEQYDIPGNIGLSPAARAARVAAVYDPFRHTLAAQIAEHRASLTLMVTVHSFTPVFGGTTRAVELGVLHGVDDRFAKAMMASVPPGIGHETRLNEPYSAADGVAHTLDLHGAPNGLLNVMIEIRNDLVPDQARQHAMATTLGAWIDQTRAALRRTEAAG
ncbi:N-formylglutamate amidohydrolase [Cognatishimia sp. F0-27]|uniref:N-formylglutamate amidohydrolase n=1 Tax=Cognatishimia sp. F0-27 TaxID=2816855 RepID=UPI001D0C12A9|nr:N-formylglutamate amidohydrolase [Cognatishimia sp. F0-27]MCC1494717.1 N-formylglutamate amidohydrolase [Cognatishimia sp. F0-27]